MSYLKQTWADDLNNFTPITPSRLNHMEDGIKENSDAWDSICHGVRRAAFLRTNQGIVSKQSQGDVNFNLAEYGFANPPFVCAMPYGSQNLIWSLKGDECTATQLTMHYYAAEQAMCTGYFVLLEPM